MNEGIDASVVSRSDDTRAASIDMLIALLPAFIWAVTVFGWRAIFVTAISVGSCMGLEYLYFRAVKKSYRRLEPSTAVVGVLLSFGMPSRVALWLIPVGAFIAIAVRVLQGNAFKGTVVPVITARVLLSAFRGTGLMSFLEPVTDAPASDTVLSSLSSGVIPEDIGILKAFFGFCPGNIGEVSVFLLLLGGVYLTVRRVISWETPLAFIGTVAAWSVIFPRAGGNAEFMLYSLFSGGLIFCAVFVASDRNIAPLKAKGRLLFGVGCGAATLLIRGLCYYPDGAFLAVMITLICTYIMRRFTASFIKKH